MTALPLALVTALMLGALHAFDTDHLAAVTAFIARRPSPLSAAGFALRWALGHATTLVAVGMAATLFGFVMSPGLKTASELAVGATLVGLGLRSLRGPRHAHTPTSSVFWIGALHGLAGSAGILVIIPIALLSSPWAVLAYIAAFSLGVTCAMACYALSVGKVLGKVHGGAGAAWYPWLSGAAASCTVLLGLAWISLIAF